MESKPKRRPRTSNTHLRIPEGIIIEILWRLPVKSLLKFKSVSKSWRSFISSKYFKKTYLENSKKHKTFPHHHIMISNLIGPINSCPVYPLLTEQSTHAAPLDYPRAYLRETIILGSCNGLICIVVNRDEISLWNPATRELKELPDFFQGVTGVEELHYHYLENYGFAFDESSGDYKVYALFSLSPMEPTLSAIGKMYSLKSGSWGETAVYYSESSTPLHGTINSHGMFASGKLHWIRNNKIETKSKWEIVFLDLKSESFGVVEKPSFMEDDFVPRLGVHNGCLCLFCECPNRYDMWIWNKYGVEESWVKFASISHSSDSWKNSFLSTPVTPYTSILLCMFPNGEVLFSYRTSECLSKFVIYNPKDNGFRQRDIVDFEDVDQMEVYTESLVSLVLDDADVEEGEASLGITV